MKKTLLCLFALFLTATAVSAQGIALGKGAAKLKGGSLPTTAIAPQVFNAPQTRSDEPASNERIMGFYNTDELDLSGASNVGLVALSPGTYKCKAAIGLAPANIGNFVGGKITKVRYALSEDNGAGKLFISKMNEEGTGPDDPIVEVDVPETHAGWNVVTLPTAITIEENQTYIIGYEYNQTVVNQGTGQDPLINPGNYPIVVDYVVNPNAHATYGCMGYCEFEEGIGFTWYDLGESLGNICIQAFVEGGNFADEDLTLSQLQFNATSTFVKSGNELDFNFNIMSMGNNIPSSYKLNVSVDGAVVTTLENPIQLTHQPQTVNAKVSIPSNIFTGTHTIAVSVAEINGKEPTTAIDDDMISGNVNVYNNEIGRQKNLVEEFTSTRCAFCPLGHETMNELAKLRDDLVFVGVHNDTPYASAFMNEKSLEISNNLLIDKHNPSAAFNRWYLDDPSMNPNKWVDFQTSWPGQEAQYAQIFNIIIDMSNEMPSFAAVDIATNYDPSTRQLNVTVSGKTAREDLDAFVPNAALTVYLTEDGVVAPQTSINEAGNESIEIPDYVHNHILRDVLTETLGEPLQFVDGENYSMTYTTTLDAEWNADNMNVVAFIGRPVTAESWMNDVFINQVNSVKVGGTVGINNVGVTEGNVKEVARYSLDGRQLSRPEKGINIIKMSDGSTRKVIVKQ